MSKKQEQENDMLGPFYSWGRDGEPAVKDLEAKSFET